MVQPAVPMLTRPATALFGAHPPRLGEARFRRLLAEARLRLGDVGQRRQARLVAEVLDGKSRRRAGESEVLLPARLRPGDRRMDIGAVEDVAGAVGIDDAVV